MGCCFVSVQWVVRGNASAILCELNEHLGLKVVLFKWLLERLPYVLTRWLVQFYWNYSSTYFVAIQFCDTICYV